MMPRMADRDVFNHYVRHRVWEWRRGVGVDGCLVVLSVHVMGSHAHGRCFPGVVVIEDVTIRKTQAPSSLSAQHPYMEDDESHAHYFMDGVKTESNDNSNVDPLLLGEGFVMDGFQLQSVNSNLLPSHYMQQETGNADYEFEMFPEQLLGGSYGDSTSDP